MLKSWRRELDAALRAAQAAGAEAMKYFGGPVPVAAKPDGSVVTRADHNCERAIMSELSGAFPEYGFLGEESGESPRASGIRWIVDPIDGTRQFAAGILAWAIFIALEADGRRVLGVIYSPATREWAWATLGGEALYNGRPIRLSPARHLAEATIVHGDTERMPPGGFRRYVEAVCQRAGRCVTTDQSNGPMEVAAGRAAAMIDTGKTWDHAASECIVTQAGGRFTDCHAQPRIDTGTGICSNALIHDELLALHNEITPD